MIKSMFLDPILWFLQTAILSLLERHSNALSIIGPHDCIVIIRHDFPTCRQGTEQSASLLLRLRICRCNIKKVPAKVIIEITVTNITYRISLMQSNCIYISPLYRKYYINIKFIRLLQYKNRWENNSPHLTHIKTIFFTLDFML